MIEFKGNLSEKVREHVLGDANFDARKIALLVLLAPLPGSIALCILFHSPVALIIHVAIAAVLFLISFIPQKAKPKGQVYTHICFDDECVFSYSKFDKDIYLIEKVKTVKDYELYYELEISHSLSVINDIKLYCQKDLITQGTLEEFESLFEGKLVKMYGEE